MQPFAFIMLFHFCTHCIILPKVAQQVFNIFRMYGGNSVKQNYDFINEPTKKALFRMFLPMMIGMLLNFAYNIVDTLWVGNLMGGTALAALTNDAKYSLYFDGIWITLLFSFVAAFICACYIDKPFVKQEISKGQTR